jgi:hypothetical protein
MPTDKVWPKDKLGNRLVQGRLIIMKLDDPDAMFYVDKVTPASFLHSPEGPMPINGEIELVLRIKLPFTPERNQLHRAIVVEQPDPEKLS